MAIVIIGGYNSIWTAYLKMARNLEDLAGLQAIGVPPVATVPLMPWHWWQARRRRDASPLLHKLAQTVAWARRKFQADLFILVGHSAGGILGRLYLSEEPVWGHTYAGAEHTIALITLGSPHCSQRDTEIGWFLADEANRLVPGSPYSGQVYYQAVAGRAIQGRENGNYRQRQSYRTYSYFAGQGDAWGDGLVPVESAGLAGAESRILENVVHSRRFGAHWYGGSKNIIRRWWPQEVVDAG